MKKNYLITTAGRFHHFDVAKAILSKNQLSKIVSGYPWFKIKNEKIPKKYVEADGIYRIARQLFIHQKYFKNFDDYLNIKSAQNLDRITSKIIDNDENIDVLIGQSQCALQSGIKFKEKKKLYICERTSSHIEFQDNILNDEYKSLGLNYKKINNWYIDREKQEYENSGIILVPSNFVKSTFNMDYQKKIKVLEFGVNTKNFFRDKKIKKSTDYFDILYLAQKSVRKGFHYVLDAFGKFKHPKKRLHIIGTDTIDKKFFKKKIDPKNMIVYGHIQQSKLNDLINFCHVYILPSIEDGFATTILQVASAGCPVIVTENTGSADFVRKSECGYVIPIRDVNSILEKITYLADNKDILEKLSVNGQNYLKKHDWNNYFEELEKIVNSN